MKLRTGIGIWLPTAVAVLFSGLFISKWAQPVEGLLTDLYTRHAVVTDERNPRVLIVRSEWSVENRAGYWTRLIDEVTTLDPAGIVLSRLPRVDNPDFYRRLGNRKHILVGRSVEASPRGTFGLESWPPAASSIPFAIAEVASLDRGIARFQRTHLSFEGRQYPLLEYAAAARFGFNPPAVSRYRVDFIGGRYQLPEVNAQRIVAGEMIPQLVKGRIVVVGIPGPSPVVGVQTPVTTDGTIPLYEFQAYGIQTLATGRLTRPVPAPVAIGVMLLVGLLSGVMYQVLPTLAAVRATALLSILYLSAGYVLFTLAGVVLPTALLVAEQVTLALVIVRRRAAQEDEQLRAILLERADRLRRYVIPQSIADTEEHWTHLVNLVDQYLPLRRFIFLERVENDHRVREVKALRCSLDDISERRRDYQRTPYSTALEEQRPVRVEHSNYFKNPDPNEEQFVAPLYFAGEVLGFWAFTLNREQLEQLGDLTGLLGQFSEQIGEMLFHRRELRRQRAQQHSWRRYLHMSTGSTAYRQLADTLAVLDRHTGELENAFNGLTTPTIVYDLFGRAVHMNREMEEYARGIDIRPYQATALDFITTVTTLSMAEARNVLRRVIIDKENETLQTQYDSEDAPGISVELAVVPLTGEHDHRRETEPEGQLFRVTGILFELIDPGIAGVRLAAAGRLTRRLGGLLAQVPCPEQVERLLDQLRTTLGPHASEVLDQRESVQPTSYLPGPAQVGEDAVEKQGATVTTDPAELISSALERYEKVAEAASVRLKPALDPHPVRVQANHGLLRQLIDDIMEILIQDALASSTVHIETHIDTAKGECVVILSNRGFGLPAERFRDYVRDGGNRQKDAVMDPLRESLQDIARASTRLKAESDARVTGTSRDGEGMRFTIRLRISE